MLSLVARCVLIELVVSFKHWLRKQRKTQASLFRAVVVRLTTYKMENVVALDLDSVGTASIFVNIFLSLEGRWPQANLYSQFCYDVLDNLLPNDDKDVFIDSKLSHHTDNQAAGYCYGFTDEVYIEIARNSHGIPYTLDEIARNLAHELVHAKQYIRGELNATMTKWLKQEIPHGPRGGIKIKYRSQPWEIEAFEREQELVELLWT